MVPSTKRCQLLDFYYQSVSSRIPFTNSIKYIQMLNIAESYKFSYPLFSAFLQS